MDFEEKARETEALAAACRHANLRASLEQAAKDFRFLAKQTQLRSSDNSRESQANSLLHG